MASSSTAGAIRAGRAFVELFADDSKLVSSLRWAQHSLDAFGRDLLRIGAIVSGMGAAMAAPFVLSTKIFTETGDRLDAMSRRTGLAVETLSQLELATQLTDFTMQGFENAMKRMQRTMVQVQLGTEEASRAIGFLGLRAENLIGLSPEEQLMLVADRLAGLSDATLRAGAAMAIFGREATGILPMLMQGAKGLKEYKKLSEALGLTIEQDVVKAADHFNDVLEIFRMQINRAAMAVGGALSKELTPLSEKLVRVMSRVLKWARANDEIIRTAAKIVLGVLILGGVLVTLGVAAIFASKAIAALVMPFTLIKTLVAGLSSSFSLLAKLLFTRLGLITAVLLIAGGAWLYFSGQGVKAIEWLRVKIHDFGQVFSDTLQGISDALMAGDLTAAANVAWLGMKVAFLIGTDALNEVWQRLWTRLQIGALNSLDQIQTAWLTVLKYMADTMVTTWAKMSDLFDELAFWGTDAFITLGRGFKDFADDVAVALVGGPDSIEVRAQLHQETIEKETKARTRNAARFLERNNASKEQLKKDLQEVTDIFEKKMAAIGSSNIGTTSMLQDELNNSLQASKEQLRAAKDEFEIAIAKARDARRDLNKEPLEMGDISQNLFDAIGEVFDMASTQILSAGHFTMSSLLGQGGASTTGERTAKATEQSAKFLESIKKRMETAKAIFTE